MQNFVLLLLICLTFENAFLNKAPEDGLHKNFASEGMTISDVENVHVIRSNTAQKPTLELDESNSANKLFVKYNDLNITVEQPVSGSRMVPNVLMLITSPMKGSQNEAMNPVQSNEQPDEHIRFPSDTGYYNTNTQPEINEHEDTDNLGYSEEPNINKYAASDKENYDTDAQKDIEHFKIYILSPSKNVSVPKNEKLDSGNEDDDTKHQKDLEHFKIYVQENGQIDKYIENLKYENGESVNHNEAPNENKPFSTANGVLETLSLSQFEDKQINEHLSEDKDQDPVQLNEPSHLRESSHNGDNNDLELETVIELLRLQLEIIESEKRPLIIRSLREIVQKSKTDQLKEFSQKCEV